MVTDPKKIKKGNIENKLLRIYMVTDPKKIKKGNIENKLLRICQHCVGNSFCKFCDIDEQEC